MNTSEFTTIIVTASEGYRITQKEDVDIEKRIIAETLALGAGDSIDNWKEITIEEADKYIEERNALLNK